MKTGRFSVIGVLAAVFALVEAAYAGPAGTMAIEGGRWFDGTGFVASTWYVSDGKLTRTPPARIDIKLDATGRYIVPPYADAHTHNMQNPWGAANFAPVSLKSGVFYSSQLCVHEPDIRGFRALMNQPNTPDVLFATACVSASDGHPLGLLLKFHDKAQGAPDLAALRKLYVAVDTEAEFAARWDELLAQKPDFIKVLLIDSAHHAQRFGDPALLGRNGLNPALLPGIVKRAHAAGVRVIAHGDTAADVRVAAQAGVDMIAHLPGYRIEKHLNASDYRLDEETIALLASRKTPLIATASIAMHSPSTKGPVLETIQKMQKDNLARLLKAGVPILVGSDNPMGGPIEEVEYLDGLGVMPRARLLATLTMDTPRAMYPARALGRFDEGAEASFLILGADPLTDLKALQDIAVRVKQGSILNF